MKRDICYLSYLNSFIVVNTGSFVHRFTTVKEHFFWSGFVDIYTTTYFGGKVIVKEKPSSVADVVVKVDGKEAKYTKPGAYIILYYKLSTLCFKICMLFDIRLQYEVIK